MTGERAGEHRGARARPAPERATGTSRRLVDGKYVAADAVSTSMFAVDAVSTSMFAALVKAMANNNKPGRKGERS
jgi:hypothetical protein